MAKSFKVTKLDAVRRQLDVAVRLYFAEDDPIAIHTLTAAAHQVLEDLNAASAGSPTLKSTILALVGKQKLKEARQRLRAAQNFFKHADADHDAELEFLPSQTEILLFDACLKYQDMTKEIVETLAAYQTWFWLGPGAELIDTTNERKIERFRALFKGSSRRSFFKEVVPMLRSIQAGKHGT